MIKVRNINSGEEVKVSSLRMLNGRICAYHDFPEPTAKWCVKYMCVTRTQDVECDAKHDNAQCRVFVPSDGWVLDVARKPREPRTGARKPSAKKSPKASVEPVAAQPEPINTAEPIVEPAPEPLVTLEPIEPEPITPEPVEPAVAMASNVDETAMAIAAALKGLQVKAEANLSREEVAKMISEEIDRLSHKMRCVEFKVVTPTATNTITGSVCEHFQEYCNLVNAGKPLYLYGPAGCGKSYTAKQVAEALGLDYYETSQAMFAHELKGYGDAKGEFVPTAFYRAFVNGGVFFLDEVDASAPEAVVVLNNAIANKRFDFPVVGNVEAHKDFRVIAAGNTKMTGATLAYAARQMQDSSFKNRFFFQIVSYDTNIEVELANGDLEIVEFAHDMRKAARETGIFQLVSYRQISDLATLQECVPSDEFLVRGSVLQEKEVDETSILYEHLEHKHNRWAKAVKACIETMKNEEVW